MPNLRVCALFRPLNSKEKSDHGDSVCIRAIDSESFIFKDEKEEESEFQFDKVFYQGSEQADIYEFLAFPVIEGVVKGVNGAVITYGQTGAGKTYSMEGPSVIDSDEKKKGLLSRVVDGLFNIIKQSDEMTKYTVKLSMVEIYMERVRDLFDLSKDNLQIKENKVQGIYVSGVTEELKKEKRSGKLILVDLAGSEKAEKTRAEGKVFEEAKTINKSLSALGNVINALTCTSQAKANHIPYRDSKLTRILQDALVSLPLLNPIVKYSMLQSLTSITYVACGTLQGGNSQTALLCCCSPSPSNAPESLSTLRFGTRAKHIKALPRVSLKEDEDTRSTEIISSTINESRERILEKLGQKMNAEDVQLLEQLLILEGIFFDPNSVEEVESAYEDVTSRTISSMQETIKELITTVEKIEQNLCVFFYLSSSAVGTGPSSLLYIVESPGSGGPFAIVHAVFGEVKATSSVDVTSNKAVAAEDLGKIRRRARIKRWGPWVPLLGSRGDAVVEHGGGEVEIEMR
ncbi:hypothetical protein RD792_013275 [Penstemon davidsonii]|uniref:Kinesin-like protein n=1 Tax=Penstemon davidsonii TaxID=160366 RepID=A0ABR0CT11_9LAMI|nr:hypothetical protein RD792_013275 [Penstemon davidsonii]